MKTTKTIAMVNQKGGVGKTTSVMECAFHLGQQGFSVVVVDLDSQCNSTKMLLGARFSQNEEYKSIFHLLIDTKNKVSISDVIQPAVDAWPNVLIIPGDVELSSLDAHVSSRMNRERILQAVLAPLRGAVDFILLDLGPTMTLLTTNALVAADGYLIPTDLSKFSQDGMATLQKVASLIKESGLNPKLECLGIFFTSFHKGGAIAVRKLIDEITSIYGEQVLPIHVPHAVKILQSQDSGKPVGAFEPESPVSLAYQELVKKIIQPLAEVEQT